MNDKRVVVIGAANIDIAGQAQGELMRGDSNLGKVRLSYGGVGRNIAHNLALLGTDVHLIAPFGDDVFADTILKVCLEAGIDLEHSFRVSAGATSTYLYITDAQGEMQLAINDMDIVSSLTRERLEPSLDFINAADACVIDANLAPETLNWITQNVQVPLFADPISCAKASRLANSIGQLHAFKPNLLEAQELTGASDVELAAEVLLETGLKQVFISRGTQGLLAADAEQKLFLPQSNDVSVVNTTGAGDAMMAAIVWAYLEAMNLEEAGRAGLAASAITVESEETVNPALSAEFLIQRMEDIL